MIRASVFVPLDAVVVAGDYLAAGPDGNRPIPATDPDMTPPGAFARVIDPTPGERGSGGYPVRCELIPRKTFWEKP